MKLTKEETELLIEVVGLVVYEISLEVELREDPNVLTGCAPFDTLKPREKIFAIAESLSLFFSGKPLESNIHEAGLGYLLAVLAYEIEIEIGDPEIGTCLRGLTYSAWASRHLPQTNLLLTFC